MDWKRVLFVVAVVYLVARIADQVRPYDSTDPPNGRSGLILYTDHLTGCQYLARPIAGSMTPRMDGRGRHVGCKEGGA